MADKGNADAQSYLGVMYEKGWGVPAKDYAEALKWYRTAADQGDTYAQKLIFHSRYPRVVTNRDRRTVFY